MIPRDADDLWRCDLCGAMYVVPAQARDCERVHEREKDADLR